MTEPTPDEYRALAEHMAAFVPRLPAFGGRVGNWTDRIALTVHLRSAAALCREIATGARVVDFPSGGGDAA